MLNEKEDVWHRNRAYTLEEAGLVLTNDICN